MDRKLMVRDWKRASPAGSAAAESPAHYIIIKIFSQYFFEI